jgi:peptide/nickel transport system permease protein
MSETVDNVTAASAEGVAPDEPSFYEPKIGLRILYRRPGFGLAVLYMTLLILIGVFASVVAPYDPIKQDYISVLAPFSSAHWLGTDDIGRDVLSRLIWGARPTLIGVVIAIATASLIGIPWGLVAGYTGGWLDLALMRFADSVLVFPGIILALALTSALGPSLVSTMFSLGVVFSPILARVVRAGVLTVSFKDYVIVTRMYGLSSSYRIWCHVLPNILAPTVVQLTLLSGLSVLAQTGLNFLGLGVPNPNPSWGNSVAETYRYIVVDPMAPVIPGLAVVFTVLAIYRIGDEVRDQLNIH